MATTLVSLLFIIMIPIDCKITNFSSYLFVYFFESIIHNYGWFIHTYCFKWKSASRINYWNAHKSVCCLLSYVLSVTQQCKQRTAWKASLQSIQPLQTICDRACENRACGLLKFQTLGSLNFLFQYGTATKFSKFVDNLFGFTTLLTKSKNYISILRCVLSMAWPIFAGLVTYGKFTSKTCAPLHSVVNGEQHEKYLFNRSSHYGKFNC